MGVNPLKRLSKSIPIRIFLLSLTTKAPTDVPTGEFWLDGITKNIALSHNRPADVYLGARYL